MPGRKSNRLKMGMGRNEWFLPQHSVSKVSQFSAAKLLQELSVSTLASGRAKKRLS